jgi:hypothetical protein
MVIMRMSFSYFSKVVKENFAHVKVPWTQRFAKCAECTKTTFAMERTRDRLQLKALEEKRQVHYDKWYKERSKYWLHIAKAKAHPEQYLSIILDGMDQHKRLIPRLKQESAKMQKATHLKLHLVGVLVHGIGSYVYMCTESIASDSNLTIECLLRTIVKLKRPLPPVLYVQADNCSRENKNMYVLGMLAQLVQMKVFRKV